jgi:hypothetical protein
MYCASLLETVTEKSATAVLLATPEGKNNEIHLFGIHRAGKIRRYDRGRAKRSARRMLRAQRSSARQRTSCHRSTSSASGDRVDPVLEKNGKVATTDGPYAETKEQLGGIQILEARDLNHAVQLISQLPGFKYGLGPVEIRPVADISEMMKESEQRRRRKDSSR